MRLEWSTWAEYTPGVRLRLGARTYPVEVVYQGNEHEAWTYAAEVPDGPDQPIGVVSRSVVERHDLDE